MTTVSEDTPMPAIYTDRALSRDGTKITSRLYLDHLKQVLDARKGDGLLLRPPFQWAA